MSKHVIIRSLSAILAVCLLALPCAGSLAAVVGFDNFSYSGKYKAGQFRDVHERSGLRIILRTPSTSGSSGAKATMFSTLRGCSRLARP